MKKLQLKRLMNETQFKLSKNDRITYIATGQAVLNLKGGIERLCKCKIGNTIYKTPYIINANRFVYVDTDTAVIE